MLKSSNQVGSTTPADNLACRCPKCGHSFSYEALGAIEAQLRGLRELVSQTLRDTSPDQKPREYPLREA